jgi:hypothetical protein
MISIIRTLTLKRVIQLKLVKVEGAASLLNLRQRILKQLEIVKKTGFYFPVKRFFNAETGKFEINDILFQAAEVRFCRTTQSHAQNEVITILNELCETLNKLHRKNILRAKHGATELLLIDDFIEVLKEQPDDPFVVKDTVFYTNRLHGYRVKGVQSRNLVTPEKILS